ncbi:hypothetical protein BCF11_0425 [Collimonas sp. PA-H2]|uniref:hypothetical protein n=1 Tax=Collimonas sp. PA-H2 TaxID=1881062 RepID=UPI000BF7F92E|nr:hypothetical protein [Collimonas sp. PA-H2]PFH08073.1 hypothetical protein BCF11_0425 [Collimonas sp. PA-H2]
MGEFSKTLKALALLFCGAERPVGIVLEEETVLAQALAAARYCGGYGPFDALLPAVPVAVMPSEARDPWESSSSYPRFPVPDNLYPSSDFVELDTPLTQSEWAIVRSLFILYVERENAVYLEASRSLGVDVYGRSASEIAQDIVQKETDVQRLMFCMPIVTV